MTEFILSLALFILAHTLPEPTGLRSGLINKIGKKAYVAGYSLLSTILLIWLIWSALRAPFTSLWLPTSMTAVAPVLLMLPVCILLSTAILRPNPLSLAFVQSPGFAKPGITTILRHPLLWALFLWSTSHTIANGDLVGVIMFGGFAVFSLAGMKIFERRASRHMSRHEFETAMAKTDGPMMARLKKVISVTFVVEAIIGIFLYIIALHLHEPVIGIDPLVRFLP